MLILIREFTPMTINHLFLQADWQYEASAYGFKNFEGDPNDDFIVEIDQRLPLLVNPEMSSMLLKLSLIAYL